MCLEARHSEYGDLTAVKPLHVRSSSRYPSPITIVGIVGSLTESGNYLPMSQSPFVRFRQAVLNSDGMPCIPIGVHGQESNV
jgi:hypothetical protein